MLSYLTQHVLLWLLLPVAAAFLFRRYRRLSNLPGPFLANFTDLWRAYYQNVGEYPATLEGIHKKYGSVVRVGPNTVSVSDASAVSTIYSLHGEFVKADSYSPVKGYVHGKVVGTILDMQDEHLISALRRAIGGAFALSNLLDYEDDVDAGATALIERLSRQKSFNLWHVLHQFQVDFFMRMAFSDEPSYLATDKDPNLMSGQIRLCHWFRWQALPTLEAFFYKNPYLSKTSSIPYFWAVLSSRKLAERKTEKNVSRQTDLLDKYIEAGDKHRDTVDPELILKTVASTIGAGLDTTPFTMTASLYYLMKNPRTYSILQQELDDAIREGTLTYPIPRYTEADKLPYLAAVIKEAMRIYPFLSISLERVVPAGGAVVAEKHLPGGTIVGCHTAVVHRDPAVFGDDVDVFRPERWIECGKEQAYVMEKSSLGFGNGKRGCLGRHIAELEMKKVIPSLMLMFKMKLDDPNTILTSEDGFTPFPKPIHVTVEKKI